MVWILYDDILLLECRPKNCILHTGKLKIEFYTKLSEADVMLLTKRIIPALSPKLFDKYEACNWIGEKQSLF